MININIVCVGNLKEKFWKDASSEYEKRLSKFCKLKIIEIEEQNRFLEIDKIKEAEGLKILEHLEGECFLLDLNGKEYSSEEFADRLEKISLSSSLITLRSGAGTLSLFDLSDEPSGEMYWRKAGLWMSLGTS